MNVPDQQIRLLLHEGSEPFRTSGEATEGEGVEVQKIGGALDYECGGEQGEGFREEASPRCVGHPPCHGARPEAPDNGPMGDRRVRRQPFIRACMPRYLFLLFYSRLFHQAPAIGHDHKDNPEFDWKHHIRYVDLSSLSGGGQLQFHLFLGVCLQ